MELAIGGASVAAAQAALGICGRALLVDVGVEADSNKFDSNSITISINHVALVLEPVPAAMEGYWTAW